MAESSTSAQQALPTGNESKHITEGTLMHLTSCAFLALLACPVLAIGQLLGVVLNRWMIDCYRFCGILCDALTPTLYSRSIIVRPSNQTMGCRGSKPNEIVDCLGAVAALFGP
jgi:hypothetical protein